MLENIIKNYLINTKELDPIIFEDPNLIISNLGLDSLDIVEMLFEIEDRCGFQLKDPMRYQNMTFKAMVNDIETQTRDHFNGELPVFNLNKD